MNFVTGPPNDSAETVFKCIQNSLNKGNCDNCTCPDNDAPAQCSAVRKLGGIFLTIENTPEHVAAENHLLNILQNIGFSQKIKSTALYCLKINLEIASLVATAVIIRFEDDPKNEKIITAAKEF